MNNSSLIDLIRKLKLVTKYALECRRNVRTSVLYTKNIINSIVYLHRITWGFVVKSRLSVSGWLIWFFMQKKKPYKAYLWWFCYRLQAINSATTDWRGSKISFSTSILLPELAEKSRILSLKRLQQQRCASLACQHWRSSMEHIMGVMLSWIPIQFLQRLSYLFFYINRTCWEE